LEKLKILTFADYYLPSYKAGGPIQTLANLVERFGNEFKFRIITRDRDFGNNEPHFGINVNSWQKVGKSEVVYLVPEKLSLLFLRHWFQVTEHNVVYLNSFFSYHFTIKPLLLRRLHLIPNKPYIVAPRGEFSSNALGLKKLKKRVYIQIAKAFGLYRGIIWQASSIYEEEDIRRWFGKNVPVIVAPNLTRLVHTEDHLTTKGKKEIGSLKILFLGRISKMKNLHGALKMLNGIEGKIQFTIYGPMEDKEYWAECQKTINELPKKIKVRYRGSADHQQVDTIMREHDLFFLPTLGENFGHVIIEAFFAGCPVLISDQTPWRELEAKGVGWDLSLDHPERFQSTLKKCVEMDQNEYTKWSSRAREYGLLVSQDDGIVEQNRKLFCNALQINE